MQSLGAVTGTAKADVSVVATGEQWIFFNTDVALLAAGA
jgi:hypothetical protein